jgi:hypothetical protein
LLIFLFLINNIWYIIISFINALGNSQIGITSNCEDNDDDEEKDTGCKNLDKTPGMESSHGALQEDWQFAYEVVIRR